MHLIVDPAAFVRLGVVPEVSTLPLDLVHLKISLVHRSIRKSQLAFAILLSIGVVAFVYGAVRPCFHTVAVLLVLCPLANVLGAVGVGVDAVAAGFVVEPLALINVTVRVKQLA